jgi:hypothetical protein
VNPTAIPDAEALCDKLLEEIRADIAGKLMTALSCHALRVDERPTLTRFWTLKDGVDYLLSLAILGMASNCLRLRSVRHREDNHTRLTRALRYFGRDDCTRPVRRASFALQAIDIATSLTGELRAYRYGDPLLVPPAKGVVQAA